MHCNTQMEVGPRQFEVNIIIYLLLVLQDPKTMKEHLIIITFSFVKETKKNNH